MSVTNSGTDISGAAPIEDSIWHHVAVSCDGADATLYVDGRVDGGGVFALNTSSANDIRIGTRFDDTLVFDGVIDDLRLYSKALSALEINGIFNELPPTSGGIDGDLRLWWQLDETDVDDTTAYDSSPSGPKGP